MKLIDRNKLLEGLKKLKQNLSASPIVVIEDVESLIESLEVKEVDLCIEEERIWKDLNMGECHLSKNDLEKISKHFFELGLKAQKGE
jgi:hypothetical protein